MTGKQAVIQRLTKDLRVDSGPFRRDAAWQPPYNMADGLAVCADAQRAEKGPGPS